MWAGLASSNFDVIVVVHYVHFTLIKVLLTSKVKNIATYYRGYKEGVNI